MTDPKIGDTVYHIWNGVLEKMTVLKHDLADGATIKTYIIRNEDGTKSRCSRDWFVLTELEAWENYCAELATGIEYCVNKIEQLEDERVSLLSQLDSVITKINTLKN